MSISSRRGFSLIEFKTETCPPVFLSGWTWTGAIPEAECNQIATDHGLDPKKDDFGIIYLGKHPKEVMLHLPWQAACYLCSRRYLVNLTGSRRNSEAGAGSPLFQTAVGTLGAQMSPKPVRIE